MLKYLPTSFLLTILLIRMPPFYVFPIIKSSILTSHSIARILVLVIFALMIWKKDFLKFKSSQVKLFALYLGFLFFHSLSLLNSVNLDAFLLRYKDVVFPGIFLLLSFVYLGSKRGIVNVFIISLVVNFVYQLIAYFLPALYSIIGHIFLYEGHRMFVAFNLSRGRLFIESYDEIVFPFLFLPGLYNNISSSWSRRVLPFLIIIPTMLSNFRSRLLMLVVSALMTFFAWFRSWKVVVGMGIITILLFIASDTLSLRLWGFSIIDRVLLKSHYDDVQSLTSRWDGITRSFEFGVSHPIAGIGLGNYFDASPVSYRNNFFSIVNFYGSTWIAALNPHNIFAQIISETGLISLIYYLYMLYVFVRVDIKIMQNPSKSSFSTASVIGFWSLFSFALFNPSTTLTFNVLFWLLRGMVIYENTN